MAEQIPHHSAYNYVYNNPIKFIDQQGLYGEVGEATKDHETAIAKFGKDRVGDVYFNKDKNEFAFQIYGEGKDKYEHNSDAGETKAFRPDASVYNNEQYNSYTNSQKSNSDKISELSDAFGTGMDLKEGMIAYAQKSGDLGKSGEKYLKFTKRAGKFFGYTSAIAAWNQFNDNRSTGNLIKALSNTGLSIARVNPILGVTIGFMDVLGLSDQLYNKLGNAIDNSISTPSSNNPKRP